MRRPDGRRGPSRPGRRRGRAGFTLLEASVALLLLGAVAVGTFAALGAARRADLRVQAVMPAAALAEERLTALVLAPPRELRLLPDSLRRGTVADRYAWAAAARPVPNEPDLFDLSVVVTWPDGSHAVRTRRHRPATPPAGAR